MLNYVFGTVVVLGVVALVVYLLNKGAFRKILDMSRVKVGDLGRAAENLDPVGVLRLRKEQEDEKLRGSVAAMKSAEGDLETLNRQIEENRKQIAVYETRIRSAKNLNNEQRAIDAALSLAHERKQEVKNVAQRDALRAKFDANMVQVKHVQGVLHQLELEANSLGAELKSSEIEKNLSETLSKMAVSIDAGGVAEARENVKRAIDKNRGAVRVDAELNGKYMDEIAENEEMRKMEARKILEEFK